MKRKFYDSLLINTLNKFYIIKLVNKIFEDIGLVSISKT